MSGDGSKWPRRQPRAAATPTRRTPRAPARGRARSALTVVVTNGRGRTVRVPGLASWLVGIAPRDARGEVGVAIVSDADVRTLNRLYRGKDATTDVLSFPAQGSRRAPARPDPSDWLGDVVIARGVAGRQAKALGHSLTVELKVLALHGVLHLLGHDHERDGGKMARVERRLRRAGGLPSGLIERGDRR